jgi:adenosylcobinamide-GDP ribazoletransferase
MRASVPWFPVVGAAIGAVVGGVAAGMMELVTPPVAAGLAVVVGMVVTGAFHEDGLADTADAFGGWSPEQRREILDDSRHGSYGVAAMCSTILLRTLCLASLGPAAAFAGAVASHALGRGCAVGAMGVARPLPEEGLGAAHTRVVSRRRALVGLLIGLALAMLALGTWALAAAAVAIVVAAAMIAVTDRAFGGIGGDVLGAIEQVTEVVVLVTAVAFAARHELWWR